MQCLTRAGAGRWVARMELGVDSGEEGVGHPQWVKGGEGGCSQSELLVTASL